MWYNFMPLEGTSPLMPSPDNDLSVTAVICTYTERRWHLVSAAIASLRKQTRPADQILLVVDHNPRLAEALRDAHPDVSVVENHHANGLSGGKNTALDVVTTPLMAVLDDDATADVSWLESLLEHFASDEIVAAGSASRPAWEIARPRWFPPELDWTIGCSYEGMPTVVADVRNIFGGAMVVRTGIARDVGGFRTDMGRIGGSYGGAEETEFCIRLARAFPGARIVYDPRVHIDHHVPATRARWSYVWRRCFGEGASKALMRRHAASRDALSTEQQFLSHTIPAAVRRDVRERRFAATGALLTSLGAAGVGYTITTAKLQVARWR